MKYTADHAHNFFLLVMCPMSAQYVCLSAWNSALLIYHIIAHIYFLKGPLHQLETSSHNTFSVNIIYPYTH
jgi:hypothetical protein